MRRRFEALEQPRADESYEGRLPRLGLAPASVLARPIARERESRLPVLGSQCPSEFGEEARQDLLEVITDRLHVRRGKLDGYARAIGELDLVVRVELLHEVSGPPHGRLVQHFKEQVWLQGEGI